jgi:hypothetical protein
VEPTNKSSNTARHKCTSEAAPASITRLTDYEAKGGNIDFVSVLLSYHYLYTRTRGHEVLTRSSANPTDLRPDQPKETQHESTGSFGSALPFSIQKEIPELYSFFLRIGWNAFFLFLTCPSPFP